MLRRLVPVLVAVSALLGGCQKLPPGAKPTVQAPVAIAAETGATVVGRAGEQMTYRISIHGIEVAEMQVTIGEVTKFEGHDAMVVQIRSQSAKLLSWVHPIDDTLTSWIDPVTGRPLAFQVTEMASRTEGDYESSEMRFAKGSFTVQGERHGQPFEEQQVVQDQAFDMPSMLTFFRSWDGEPGTQVIADVMRARNAWRTQVAVVGVENLSTALGDLPVVRYDGQGQRLRRDGTLDPGSDQRKYSIWVSDDADRVPAKLVARTDYGDVEVDLVAYRAP